MQNIANTQNQNHSDSLSSICFAMQVSKVDGDDVTCVIKNDATLSGSLYTLHVSQIRIDLPTLTDKDKQVTNIEPCT
jgi:pyruvate kinase